MKPERILLPIDIARCPLEAFDVINGFAERAEVTLILLHVITLNILSPTNRVFEELGQEAQFYLQRLGNKHLHSVASTIVHVRTGNLADQILVEVKSERADLIVLPTYGPSFWDRLRGLWKPASNPIVSRLAERLIREATCGVFLVLAKSRFNRERAWGRPGKGSIELSKSISPTVSAAH